MLCDWLIFYIFLYDPFSKPMYWWNISVLGYLGCNNYLKQLCALLYIFKNRIIRLVLLDSARSVHQEIRTRIHLLRISENILIMFYDW